MSQWKEQKELALKWVRRGKGMPSIFGVVDKQKTKLCWYINTESLLLLSKDNIVENNLDLVGSYLEFMNPA